MVMHTDRTPELSHLLCLTGKDGKEVRVIESVTSNWKSIAATLDFDEYRINTIELDYRNRTEACLEVFRRWRNEEHGLAKPPSWNTLIKCLNRAGFLDIATNLKKTLLSEI